MTTLTPSQAWYAAQGIYDAKLGLERVKRTFSDQMKPISDLFSFSDLKLLESKTGAFIKVKSGFAVIARGKTTANSSEVLVAIRGTDLAADWLTDGNFGVQVSGTGKIVHAGFNRVFAELEPHLSRYFSQNSATTVHCVGHSLGGALASLTADWVTQKNIGKAKLYTFGCPRVGFSSFARRVTDSLDPANIFRVHHDNDFVSLVPIWPFCHTPMPGTSCNISNHGFGTFGAHKMDNYEISLAQKSDEWAALRSNNQPIIATKEIENWLSLDTVSVISAYSLNLIAKAVQYILKAVGIGAQFVIGTGFTVLDKLSYAMEFAWNAGKEVAGWVEYLIKKILSLVGHGLVVIKNITQEFIRWVFRLLNDAVGRLVNLSLLGART